MVGVYHPLRRQLSLYTGIATDVERRFGEHVSQGPKSAKYLRGRLPLEIVYRKEIGGRSEATNREAGVNYSAIDVERRGLSPTIHCEGSAEEVDVS